MEFSLFFLVVAQALGVLTFDLSRISNDMTVETCEAADIVFLLDESSSIYPLNFSQQITFVKNVIDQYEIELGNIQVGVMTFASEPTVRFHIGSVKNHDALVTELDKIKQRTGNTFTADAINLTVSSMFGQHGRAGVAKVLILITDGESENTAKTAVAARYARNQGIVIFAIGVGKNVKSELDLIASKPVDEYVHTVDNYKALEKIIEALAYQTCEVPTLPPSWIAGCEEYIPLDLIFTLSDNAIETDVISSIRFVEAVVGRTRLAADKVQVGVTPRYCDYYYPINLNKHDVWWKITKDLEPRAKFSSHIEKHIRYMYKEAITGDNGGREYAVKMGILIIDSASENYRRTIQEANAAKKLGIQLIVIAVGNNVNKSEVENIASGSGSLFRVNSYADLGGLVQAITRRLCCGLLKNSVGDYDGGIP